MIKRLTEKYKNYKKQSFLESPSKFNKQYAFIGVGGHSISNLYPVLLFNGVPIKMVYSRTLSNAVKMAERFNGAVGVDSVDTIIDNKNIQGVFICLNPEHHYEFVKKCLLAKKTVFVDKPPCTSTTELQELVNLEKENKSTCLVGLQRRYSPVYNKLKVQIKKPLSYNYRFYSGSYPEGNALYDLFIHPIDTLIYLFGEISEIKVNIIKNKKGLNVSLLTEHKSGCKGIADFSCFYSWRKIEENIRVVCEKSYFDANYPLSLTETKLQGSLMGVPLEKVLPSKQEKQLIHHYNNGLNPIKEQNLLVDQGFYGEVETFTMLTEGRKASNRSSLKDLINVYEVIDQIKSFL